MSMGQRIILVAAGAGAGIAATFNTPIGGVLFATELMLPEISVNTFLPVAIATATATFIGRLFFGASPAFDIPTNLSSLPVSPGGALILVLYVVLGVAIGAAAALFVRSLHWLEDLFDEIPGSYFRHMVGMLLVGLLIYALMRWGGHYYVEGVGYATIQATFMGQLTGVGFLLLLYVCKLLATTMSLGSGASGGIFSPSLFMGATLGGAFASLISLMFPELPISVPAFAMVGMGSMVGSGTGAAMTAVAMVFEMTRDYDIVLPMILAVAVALGVRRMLSRENIYTLKLVRRGHPIPKALHANMFLVRSARDAMDSDFMLVDEATSFDEFLRRSDSATGMRHAVITRGPLIVGVLRVNTDLRRTVSASASDVTMGTLARHNFTIVRTDSVVFDVISRLSRRRAAMGIVVQGRGRPRAENVVGVITREHIADEVANSVRMYSR
jgi:CIC family chloride channel protein